MSWVRPDQEILPRLSSHTPANTQHNDAYIVEVSQKLVRKCPVPTESLIPDLWYMNTLLCFMSDTHCTYKVQTLKEMIDGNTKWIMRLN